MKEKLFTKSAFKVALTCPTQLYYYRNHEYANQNETDEFLQALAEGGFQVGELAKVYYGIDAAHDIKTLDYEESINQTKALFATNDNVNIAEAAFRWNNCFVRVDILEKVGSTINIIEVKAKSWSSKERFMDTRGAVDSGIREYMYDAAFQKYVVTNALQQQYPDQHFTVHAYLMMADKDSVADVDGINQYFRIVKHNGRTKAVREPGAEKLADAAHVLRTYPEVDGICDSIIAGLTEEQSSLMHACFRDFVDRMSTIYIDNKKVSTPISPACKKCPFYLADGQSGFLDGHSECFARQAHFTQADFHRPTVFDLNGSGCSLKNLLAQNKIFLDNVDSLGLKKENVGSGFLSLQDRNWLQLGLATNHAGTLERFRQNIHGGIYIDIPGLRKELSSWQFPLHMIDFETATVALPFYKGMHPYEEIAFQFSHHIIDSKADGTYSIRHAGQYINIRKGHFPNFDFIRELKRQLEQDNGTIFRYSHHENNYVNAIMEQLQQSQEPDRDELIDFILSISHHKDIQVGAGPRGGNLTETVSGPRDMVDLCQVVSNYYFHPSMKGRTSIKVVLPAVLNSSRFLQQKYSQPIYGTVIPSLNIPASEPIAWITMAPDGYTVENPYHLLPSVATYIDVDESNIDRQADYDDMTIAHGGAALTAYSKLQFSDTRETEALSKALLRYCELDTMAMVFIWEYFNNVISNH